MTLSTKAAAFSIEMLLSRQDKDVDNSSAASKPFRSIFGPGNVLDLSLANPFSHLQLRGVPNPSGHKPHLVTTSMPVIPTQPDFSSKFASIESRLRQISVRQDQLTIPSFKIHPDSRDGNSLRSSVSFETPDFTRRHSSHCLTTTCTQDMYGPSLRRHSWSNLQDKPLAVKRWVKSTLGSGLKEVHDNFPEQDVPLSQISNGIKVTLVNSNLWKQFNKYGTEMILSRAGRRIFPNIYISIEGLAESAVYSIRLHVSLADGQRYKFINSQWLPVGKADTDVACTIFEHPDSPNTGAFWMKTNVSFSKLKITNNIENIDKNIVLNSMHKYIPRIWITREVGDTSVDVNQPEVSHFSFPETTFIAVTAYQNYQITQLKIRNNPFAKAFRDADVAALLQGAYKATSSDLNFGEGYAAQHRHRRSYSMDYTYRKLPVSITGLDRRRSLSAAPYAISHLRPPDFANPSCYSKAENACHLPRGTEGKHPVSSASVSSLASQQSRCGEYASCVTEMSDQVNDCRSVTRVCLTKSKAQHIKHTNTWGAPSFDCNDGTDQKRENVPDSIRALPPEESNEVSFLPSTSAY